MEIDYEIYFCEYNESLYDCGNRLKRRHIRNLLSNLLNKRILDIGVGCGDIRLDLIRRCGADPQKYISLDVSMNTLRLAGKLSKKYGQSFLGIEADAQSLPFKEKSFDAVICSEVLEHLPKDDHAMGEIRRVLSLQGISLVTVPYLGKPVLRWGHKRHYSYRSFHRLVKSADLEIKQILYIGRLHNITWVFFKRLLYKLWSGYSKALGSKKGYYESLLHKLIVMPMVDCFLYLDDLSSKRPVSLLGNKASIVALLRKVEDS